MSFKNTEKIFVIYDIVKLINPLKNQKSSLKVATILILFTQYR